MRKIILNADKIEQNKNFVQSRVDQFPEMAVFGLFSAYVQPSACCHDNLKALYVFYNALHLQILFCIFCRH